MKKYYIFSFLIITLLLFSGCQEKPKNLCVKCGNEATQWIPADNPFVCETLNLDYTDASSLAGMSVFYLCDNCFKESGIENIEPNTPWNNYMRENR